MENINWLSFLLQEKYINPWEDQPVLVYWVFLFGFEVGFVCVCMFGCLFFNAQRQAMLC